mmetsp:Transcript_93677/g.200974  ORF Transcript_93677/g.200974 Transcript_93677/m.200974 type:complete len:632 (-) Transcript_93677:38-1933(-)
MARISVAREAQKPQDYASDGTDAIGFVQFWGTSPALNLLGADPQASHYGPAAVGVSPGQAYAKGAEKPGGEAEQEAEQEGDEDKGAGGDSGTFVDHPAAEQGREEPVAGPLPEGDEPVNILIAGGADVRHLLKTVAKRHQQPGRRLRFFLHEKHHEVLARHMLLIQIMNNKAVSVRERMETFLSVYGNTLIRERDVQYISEIAAEFVELVTDNSLHPLANVVDLTHLKFKDRDVLQDIFKGWNKDAPFDIEALREQRCRGYYRERYDYRKNLMDFDYNQHIKEKAGIINWFHYKEYAFTGIAFETRLASYSQPNRTLASYTEAIDRTKGTTISVRGFWADIINSPYHTFGTTTDSQDWARLFKISGSQYRHHETDVSEFNVTAYISEMETAETLHLPPETPAELTFPYESPLDGLRSEDKRVEEIIEENPASEGGGASASGRRSGKRAPKKDWPPLVPAFEGVEVVLLSGDLGEVLKKPKYRGLFHRAFVGSMGCMPLFEEMGLGSGGDNPFSGAGTAPGVDLRIRKAPRVEAPEAFGLKREGSGFASCMAEGGEVVFETLKYQAHFDAITRLAFRLRIAQVAHLAGWRLVDERHAVPRIEHDLKESRARQLEKDASDFLRFVVAAPGSKC